jgi:hypothetical protein
VDRENLGQARDPEDFEDALLGADQAQGAFVGSHTLEAADQNAQPGGVEEIDALHVDDQVVGAAGYQVDQLLTQLGCRVDVDLAAYLDDLVIALVVGAERQIHEVLHSHMPGACPRGSPRSAR